MMPSEKNLTIAAPAHPRATITADDYAVIDRLAIKPDQMIAVTSKSPTSSCAPQDNWIVLHVEGTVTLRRACMVSKANAIGNHLAMPIETFQSRRKSHPLCKPCMSLGISALAKGGRQIRRNGAAGASRYFRPAGSMIAKYAQI